MEITAEKLRDLVDHEITWQYLMSEDGYRLRLCVSADGKATVIAGPHYGPERNPNDQPAVTVRLGPGPENIDLEKIIPGWKEKGESLAEQLKKADLDYWAGVLLDRINDAMWANLLQEAKRRG